VPPPGCPQSKVQSWKIFHTPKNNFPPPGCKGDKNFGQKNPCKLEELRWFVMMIKSFGQKNQCKLEELRWFEMVIKKLWLKKPM
jgi:hypothetical protein